MAYIEFKDVSKIYTMGQTQIRALDHISFAVEKGESTSVKIVRCKATPSADGRVFGRMDGEVTIDTDGSVKR